MKFSEHSILRYFHEDDSASEMVTFRTIRFLPSRSCWSLPLYPPPTR